MIEIVLLRTIWGVYGMIFFVLLLGSISRLLFRKGPIKGRLQCFVFDIWFGFIFPLMLFSKEGQYHLIKKLKEYT